MAEPMVAELIDTKELRSREFQRKVNELRKIDNWRNWLYIAREYLFFVVVLAPSLWFYLNFERFGLSQWVWLPVSAVIIGIMGLGQHRLVMLGHEASHYLLFKNLKLNEVAANWCCFYPMWSMCYNYRLQHLAHHQYTNDPDRDPDLIYMRATGQRFRYPMPLGKFLWDCVVTLACWVPGLVHFTLIRAKFSNLGGICGPYMPKEMPPRVIASAHMLYLVALVTICEIASRTNDYRLLFGGPAVLLGLTFVLAWFAPARWYMQTQVLPVISPRWALFQRLVFFALLFGGLGLGTILTGKSLFVPYFLWWVVPLFTSFAFFMILREDIQHSNTPAQKFRDTRDFRGSRLLKWILFPLNMDYHLGHHIFPMIPHFNLPKLERLLMQTEVYRRHHVVVEGYLWPRSHADAATDAPQATA